MDDLNTTVRPRVLVVDDETTIAHAIRMILEEHDCDVETAHTGEDALKLLPGKSFDVACLDIVLPGMNGIGVLTQIKRRSPDTQVIMMTSHASIETAIQAIRQGAYNYLHKPFEDIEDVWNQVNRAIEKRRLSDENKLLLEKQVRLNAKFGDAVMRLSALIEIGQVMVGFHSLSELLEYFTNLVAEQMGCERVSVMTLEHENAMRVASAHGFVAPVTAFDAASGAVVPMRVAESRIGMIGDASVEGDPTLGGATPMLCVPVQSWEKLLGVLAITARRSGEPYTDEDLNFLNGLAGQVSIGIERIRHAEKSRAGDLEGAPEPNAARARLSALVERAEALAQDLQDDAPAGTAAALNGLVAAARAAWAAWESDEATDASSRNRARRREGRRAA